MMTTIIAGAFVLGVVVLVHEFGHFIVAKAFGIYVKVFSIGFGKKILRRRGGETEYVLSILPFGGYVKFAGESDYYDDDIDEAEAEEQAQMERDKGEVPDRDIPPERYFLRKPKYARAGVLFAGPFMNYVTAIVIYIAVMYVQGTQVAPTTTIGEVTPGGVADSVGVQGGDRIVAIDGEPVEHWSDVTDPFVDDPSAERVLTVERGGLEQQINYRPHVEEGRITLGFDAYLTSRIGRVQKSKPAWNAGMRAGAVIESINDTTVATYEDVRRIVYANAGNPLYVRWRQGAEALADTIIPEAKDVLESADSSELIQIGVIGIGPEYVRVRRGFGQSIVDGFNTANRMTWQILSYLGKLFRGQMGVKTLGGPILITQMAGDVANWGFDYLLLFLAFFNINLCIFNLLPVLPFDGGHLAILGIETVTRRPLNRRLRDWLTQGGFILIILLMLFVVMLDLTRCSGNSLF